MPTPKRSIPPRRFAASFIAYRPPYDWRAMLGHLGARATPGVEQVEGDAYRRIVRTRAGVAAVQVRNDPDRARLELRVEPVAGGCDRAELRDRAAGAFDTGADVGAIAAHLSRDRLLRTLVAARPGLRIPGAWDPFELAVRAVLGQQVTVAAARRLAGVLVAACGEPLRAAAGAGAAPALTHAFPTPRAVAIADLSVLGMPGRRRATLAALARAAADDPSLLAPTAPVGRARERLLAIPGVGEWTAQYIALRALGDRDAFPASDLGLLRGAAAPAGVRPSAAALIARAEPWRPWRAYAAQHLWAADAHRISTARPRGGPR